MSQSLSSFFINKNYYLSVNSNTRKTQIFINNCYSHYFMIKCIQMKETSYNKKKDTFDFTDQMLSHILWFASEFNNS